MRLKSGAGILLCLLLNWSAAGAEKKSRNSAPPNNSLDAYLASLGDTPPQSTIAPGSLYDSSGRYAELARDLRASQIGDLVTIQVSDRASALSRGTVSSGRKSDAKASVSALGGPTRAAGPLSALAGLGGEQKLEGQGATTRESDLRTTLTARVVHVLPNGNLVVEGNKEVVVNSERQRVTVRGIVRWNDLNSTNRIASDRVSDLEILINGKGVVGDGVRRPGFLYRLLLGILPF